MTLVRDLRARRPRWHRGLNGHVKGNPVKDIHCPTVFGRWRLEAVRQGGPETRYTISFLLNTGRHVPIIRPPFNISDFAGVKRRTISTGAPTTPRGSFVSRLPSQNSRRPKDPSGGQAATA